MIWAEITLNLDTIAGGGVTGMLVYIMVVFMRRTADVDRRSDKMLQVLLDASHEQERRLWEERDKLIKERDDARARYEELLARTRRSDSGNS